MYKIRMNSVLPRRDPQFDQKVINIDPKKSGN